MNHCLTLGLTKTDYEMRFNHEGHSTEFLIIRNLKWNFLAAISLARLREPWHRLRIFHGPATASTSYYISVFVTTVSWLKALIFVGSKALSSENWIEKQNMLYFYLNFAWHLCHPFLTKLNILDDSANNDRLHHNHFILEIERSERLRPIFGTKNRTLEIGSCERALIKKSFVKYSSCISSRDKTPTRSYEIFSPNIQDHYEQLNSQNTRSETIFYYTVKDDFVLLCCDIYVWVPDSSLSCKL